MEHVAGLVQSATVLLELGPPDPEPRLGVAGNGALPHGTRPLVLVVAHLEGNVRVPRALVRLPAHPALKDLSGAAHIAEQLFHVDVLVPELVDARQDRHGTVEQIARVVYVALLKLLLRIPQPQGDVLWIHVQGTLKHGATTLHLPLRRLPGRVADPGGHVPPQLAHRILKLLPLSPTVLLGLLDVLEPLPLRALSRLLLPVLRLAQQLLGSDLHGRGRAVLDPRRSRFSR